MNAVSTRARSTPGVAPAAAAVVWTLVALVGFAVLPFYSSQSTWSSSDGTTGSATTQQTLIEHEGGSVVVLLLVPTAVALVGLVGAAFRMPAASIGAAGIAVAFCLLGVFSVGLFYLPAAILLVVAAVRASPRRRSDGAVV